MHDLRPILLVDDNEDDVFFMKRALKSAGINHPLQVAADGEMAIQYLKGEGAFASRADYPLPCFTFLDLKLPRRSGIEVLQWIRSQTETQGIVVVVMTSSREPKDINMASRHGANAYLVKPAAAAELLEILQAVKDFWFRYHQFPQLQSPQLV